MGNYASPRQASATIAQTATCTDPPFGAVFQTTPHPSHTIVAVLRRRLTLRSRAKAACQEAICIARAVCILNSNERRRDAWLSIKQNSTLAS